MYCIIRPNGLYCTVTTSCRVVLNTRLYALEEIRNTKCHVRFQDHDKLVNCFVNEKSPNIVKNVFSDQ